MQDRASGTLPLNLLISEIDEVARGLSHLTRRGSPLDRPKRAEIRAVVRDGFLATQEDRTIAQLGGLLEQLRTLRRDLLGDADDEIAVRIARYRDFGALDNRFIEKPPFSSAGEQRAAELVGELQQRIERTLSALTANQEEESRVGQVRPLKYREEHTELVTKKV